MYGCTVGEMEKTVDWGRNPDIPEDYKPMTRERLILIYKTNNIPEDVPETDQELLKNVDSTGVVIITNEVIKTINDIEYGFPPQPQTAEEGLLYTIVYKNIKPIVNYGLSWRKTYNTCLSFRGAKWSMGLNNMLYRPFQQIQKLSNRMVYRMKFAAIYTVVCERGVILPLFKGLQ